MGRVRSGAAPGQGSEIEICWPCLRVVLIGCGGNWPPCPRWRGRRLYASRCTTSITTRPTRPCAARGRPCASGVDGEGVAVVADPQDSRQGPVGPEPARRMGSASGGPALHHQALCGHHRGGVWTRMARCLLPWNPVFHRLRAHPLDRAAAWRRRHRGGAGCGRDCGRWAHGASVSWSLNYCLGARGAVSPGRTDRPARGGVALSASKAQRGFVLAQDMLDAPQRGARLFHRAAPVRRRWPAAAGRSLRPVHGQSAQPVGGRPRGAGAPGPRGLAALSFSAAVVAPGVGRAAARWFGAAAVAGPVGRIA